MRDPATLRQYPTIILMWQNGRNSADIADRLTMPESLVARCLTRYLDTKWKAERINRRTFIHAVATDA